MERQVKEAVTDREEAVRKEREKWENEVEWRDEYTRDLELELKGEKEKVAQEGNKQPVVAVVVEGIAQEAERKRQEWVEAENRRMLERWYWDELHDAYGRRWWRHKETHQEVSTCPF